MANTYSAGWGVLLELGELQTILTSISTSERSWSAELAEEPCATSVRLWYTDGRPDADLTIAGLTFPVFTDSFPWLTCEPLVALHPTLAQPFRKESVQQIDPIGDFAIIWPPIREALTIEALRGAAKIFAGLSGQRRQPMSAKFLPQISPVISDSNRPKNSSDPLHSDVVAGDRQ